VVPPEESSEEEEEEEESVEIPHATAAEEEGEEDEIPPTTAAAEEEEEEVQPEEVEADDWEHVFLDTDLSLTLARTIPRRGLKLHLIKWDGNSCWLDTMALALFGDGNAWPTRRFLDGAVATAHFRRSGGCTAAKAQEFYDALMKDIVQLQLDPTPMNPICPVEVRRLWDSCAVAKETEGEYGVPRDVFDSLVSLFGLANVWELRGAQDEAAIRELFTLHRNEDSAYAVEAYPADGLRGSEVVAYATSWRRGLAFANANARGYITYRLSNPAEDEGNGYYLAAVICYLGGHFTTLVRDKSSAALPWIHVNVTSAGPAHTAMPELPSWAYHIGIRTMGFPKPIMYLYFRNK